MDITYLPEALEILRTRGHYKGNSTGPDGSVCIGGAISRTRSVENIEQSDRKSDWEMVICVADELFGDRLAAPSGQIRSIIRFNDHPDTTATEVEAVLEKAIVRRYEQGAVSSTSVSP